MSRWIGGVALTVLVLASCGGEPDPSKMPTSAPPEHFTFTKIIDNTGKPETYRVRGTADGKTLHLYGSPFSTLTLHIEIINANQTTYHPTAEIRYADGTTVTCEETDPRRYPRLQRTTPDVRLPCPYFQDPAGAVVTVTDDYS
jgi:hypothetical protein